MKHKIGFNRLDRSAAHRKALHRSMVTSLFRHERITTTKAKALEVRRTAEKMITRAKLDSVHNRRLIARRIYDDGITAKLFTDIALRMKDRPGGYTRIMKLGERLGDATEMVILELVDYKFEEKTKKSDKKAAKAEDKKPAKEEAKSSEKKAPAKKASAKKTEAKAASGDKAPAEKKAPAKKKSAPADTAEAK
jgi:large subunit ribosomal protein L17